MRLGLVVALTVLLGCSSAEKQPPKPTPFDEVCRDFEEKLAKLALSPRPGSMTKDGRIRVAARGDEFTNTSPRRELEADVFLERAIAATERAGFAVVRVRRGDTSTREELVARGLHYGLRGHIHSVEGGTAASLELDRLDFEQKHDTDLEIAHLIELEVTAKLAP